RSSSTASIGCRRRRRRLCLRRLRSRTRTCAAATTTNRTQETPTMLREPTREKLVELRLDAFEKAWAQQQENPEIDRLGFDERLALLVDAECLDRHNKRLVRNLREAKL